ncbi:hypothetical protein D5S18_30285 [Nocardia panacis]|uniref:Anti-sigma-K factor RskA N-terminal domain-containing protein n=1 Tax=Nocardia panacis TaxID=2340916 RepID=A0A3A4K8W2_9NOCA|nr:hypothetical protein [Nocardia panacis]RJO69452.1 hypothetical protein D5S18_30285 [Nocardia panacis]
MVERARPDSGLLDLAYPYALDAVAEIERRHIESRLAAADPNIRYAFLEIVRTTREVLARLAVLYETRPPSRLESRVMAALDTRPVPPWRRGFGLFRLSSR